MIYRFSSNKRLLSVALLAALTVGSNSSFAREPGDPVGVRAADEIQLQKLTPTVKSFSITLDGTEYEKAVLSNIQNMVSQIFRNSRIGMVPAVAVQGEPMVDPDIKVYEHLEIFINAKAPMSPERPDQVLAGEPYKVNVTLREAGTEGGTPKAFDYLTSDPTPFYNLLKAYLVKELRLQPRADVTQ